MSFQDVDKYIRKNWHLSVRDGKSSNPEKILSLPHTYTCPCIEGNFQTMFYWDTHFTNLGLLRHGLVDLARSNTDNLLWLVTQYGFVPNSTFVADTNRSQPPYLSAMVRDVYEATGDKQWLADAVHGLEAEYEFWMTQRITPMGLSRHFHNATDDYLLNFLPGALANRLGMNSETPEETLQVSAHYLAEAETGWDFTPRFEGRCADFAPVDLNSLLYVVEMNFAWFAGELGADGADDWLARAEHRRALMTEHLWDAAEGLFLDYDYVNDRRSRTLSLASFEPLWARLATPEQVAATAARLDAFEHEHGLAACAREYEVPGVPTTRFQWGFPSGWPPLHYIAAEGLWRCGFTSDAERVARKFRTLVADKHAETGLLWEKYDVRDGSLASAEYPCQDQLGWTAGVFVAIGEEP